MKMDSWKKSVISGFISGAVMALAAVVFIHIMFFVLGSEELISKTNTSTIYEQWIFSIAGIVVAASVPIIKMRYVLRRYLAAYVLISVAEYIVGAVLLIVIADLGYPFLGIFDTIYFSMIVFPIGSAVGTVIAVIINEVKNKRGAAVAD